MASLLKVHYSDKKTGRRRRSRHWYGQYTDENGKIIRKSLRVTDKKLAQVILGQFVRKVELARAGIIDPFEAHQERPLAEHVADWEACLRASGTSDHQVRQATRCVRRVCAGCKFDRLADVSASAIQVFVARLRHGNDRDALSIRTRNFYLQMVRQFFRWLVIDRRITVSPVTHLRGQNEGTDRRHARRPLTPGELRRLVAAAESSRGSQGGLTGPDRAALYLTAAATGLRARELASLTPASFDLTSSPPVVAVAAGYSKNRKPVLQPIPAALAPTLSAFLANRPAEKPVWNSRWWKRSAEVIRYDLAAAGIPYVVSGPDCPLFADFHSLRHTYVALLCQAGVSLKQAMQLARHSDPKLTMAVYGRAQVGELASAADSLDVLLPGGGPPRLTLVAETLPLPDDAPPSGASAAG